MSAELRILIRLTKAAEPYAADQSRETDPRVGAIQPITVAEGEELLRALAQAWELIEKRTLDNPPGKADAASD